MCEEESILLKLTLGDGSQDESEAESYDSCAVFNKQQEEAANKLEFVTSLPACNETMPRVSVSLGAEAPATLKGMSVTKPNTGLEGTDVAGPSSGSEGTSVASAGSVEMGIDGPRSHVSEKTTRFWRISLVLVARKLLLRLLFIPLKGPLKKFENTLLRISWKL